MTIFKIIVGTMIVVYGVVLYNLHERISALEKEVYIRLYSTIKYITQQPISKEGDN